MSGSRAEYLKYKEVCKKIDDKITAKFKDIEELNLDEMVEYEKYLAKLYNYSKRCYKLREEYMNTYVKKDDIDRGHLKRVDIIKNYNRSVGSVLSKLRSLKRLLEDRIFEQYKNMTVSSDDNRSEMLEDVSDDLSSEMSDNVSTEMSDDLYTETSKELAKISDDYDSEGEFLDSLLKTERERYIDEMREYISKALLSMKVTRSQFEGILNDILEWVSLRMCNCKLNECKLVELDEIKDDIFNRPAVDVFTVFIYVKKMMKIRQEGGIPLIVQYYDPTTLTEKLLTEQIMSFSYEEYPHISDLMKKLEPLVFDAEYYYTGGKNKLSRKGKIIALTADDGKYIEKSAKSSDYISDSHNRIIVRPMRTEVYDSIILMQNVKTS